MLLNHYGTWCETLGGASYTRKMISIRKGSVVIIELCLKAGNLRCVWGGSLTVSWSASVWAATSPESGSHTAAWVTRARRTHPSPQRPNETRSTSMPFSCWRPVWRSSVAKGEKIRLVQKVRWRLPARLSVTQSNLPKHRNEKKSFFLNECD